MSSIQAAAGVQTGGVGGSSGFSAMDSEEFVKIIFTELQNQDPFQPNDSSALLEQLNSIRSIESDMALTDLSVNALHVAPGTHTYQIDASGLSFQMDDGSVLSAANIAQAGPVALPAAFACTIPGPILAV